MTVFISAYNDLSNSIQVSICSGEFYSIFNNLIISKKRPIYANNGLILIRAFRKAFTCCTYLCCSQASIWVNPILVCSVVPQSTIGFHNRKVTHYNPFVMRIHEY